MFFGHTDIFICYKYYIMRPHRPHMFQSMPGHYHNIKLEFTEWLYELYHIKINKISVFGCTGIFKCYKNYIMRAHRPNKLQSMPGHCENIRSGWLHKLFPMKINEISDSWAYWHFQVLQKLHNAPESAT